MSGFRGFPAEAIEFYEGLEADNSRSYWADHKDLYDAAVRAPMLALLAELEPEFGPGHTFRPHRDVRFSRDKSPYKTHQGGYVTDEAGAGWYVQISADGLMVAGGLHAPSRDQLERLRLAMADDASGERLLAVLDDLSGEGFQITEETLKRAPRGFAPDHPRISLLRRTSLTAARHWPPARWLGTVKALDRVRETWQALTPLNGWLREHVGPAREARR